MNAGSANTLRLGIGKAIITPPIGTPLAGFGDRDHGSESVADDLEVRVLWFQNSDSPEDAVCIVTADLLGFSRRITDEITSIASKNTGICPERFIFSASHTHSGPQIDDLVLGTGDTVPDVLESIKNHICKAISEASKNLLPVTLHAGYGLCEGYAINRRLFENGEVQFVANPNGLRDDVVTVISCRDAQSQEIRASLFHFTCHASLMNEYAVSADYPGEARRYIEKELGNNAVTAFLPGCGGNIRANCTFIGGKFFRGGSRNDLTIFGEALGKEVVRVAKESTTPIAPKFCEKSTAVELPFEHVPGKSELEEILKSDTAIDKIWASRLLSEGTRQSATFYIKRIDLAPEITFVAMNGEVCCEYGKFIKDLHPDAFMMPLGYSNGVIGYIPTAEMLAQGGYEPEGSCKYYGMPSPFKPEIEEIIYNGIKDVFKD